jgi:hypothetical protein
VLSQKAHIENIYIDIKNDSEKSLIVWIFTHFDLKNLHQKSFDDGETAYVNLAPANRTGWCYFKGSFEWCLHTPNNITHQGKSQAKSRIITGQFTKRLFNLST